MSNTKKAMVILPVVLVILVALAYLIKRQEDQLIVNTSALSELNVKLPEEE